MKNVLLIFTLTCLMSMSGYSQETDIPTLLQDDLKREQVYQTIM